MASRCLTVIKSGSHRRDWNCAGELFVPKERHMKRALLLLCVAALAVATSVFAQDSQVIKIVSSLPRTGSANAQAQTMVNGIKMALEEVHGKVGDFTIAYEDWDDASPERGQWDPALEAANAQKAVKDPDIMAYIGTYNS